MVARDSSPNYILTSPNAGFLLSPNAFRQRCSVAAPAECWRAQQAVLAVNQTLTWGRYLFQTTRSWSERLGSAAS